MRLWYNEYAMKDIRHTSSKLILLTLFLSIPVAVCCAGEKIFLWPEGKMPDAQPQQIAAPTAESKKPDFKPDEWRRPYIEWEEAPRRRRRPTSA